MLGVSIVYKGYLCLHHIERIYIVRHVLFNEKKFPFENDNNFKECQKSQSTNSLNLLDQFYLVSFPLNEPTSHYSTIDNSPSSSNKTIVNDFQQTQVETIFTFTLNLNINTDFPQNGPTNQPETHDLPTLPPTA